jgi:hypothetical protein
VSIELIRSFRKAKPWYIYCAATVPEGNYRRVKWLEMIAKAAIIANRPTNPPSCRPGSHLGWIDSGFADLSHVSAAGASILLRSAIFFDAIPFRNPKTLLWCLGHRKKGAVARRVAARRVMKGKIHRGTKFKARTQPRTRVASESDFFIFFRRNPLKSPESAKGIQGNPSFFAWFSLVFLGVIWPELALGL